MARTRLGVVLVVDPPLGTEIDGLRRAADDPALGRLMPHITLVPPVNVRTEDLPAALAVIRKAAGRARALPLTLGPLRAFPGKAHVAYLAVDGEAADLALLARLRVEVLQPPLARELEHDFVPHVTVTQGVDADRLAAVLAAMAGFAQVAVRFDRVHLLREVHGEEGRRWEPIADVGLGRPVIVGRGGLELELTPGELIDPEAGDALGDAMVPAVTPLGARPLVVAGRREGAVVGLAWGWTMGGSADLVGEWLAPSVDSGVREHVRSAWRSAAADRQAG